DVPAGPEFAEAGRLKGAVEVFNQVVAQNPCDTQGDVAAAGKVHVQLDGEQHGGRHQVGAVHRVRRTVDKADIPAQVVGNDHLFHVPPQDAEQPARAAAVAEPAGSFDLRAQMRVPLDRAGDHGGEEADEHRVVQQVRLHPASLAEHVDGVAQRGKGE